MADAGGRFRGEEVAARGLEEFHGRLGLEGRRIRHVDDDLSAGKRLGQPLAGEGVDARAGRARHDLMALLAKPGHDLGSDAAAAADDDDLHVLSPFDIDRSHCGRCERRLPAGRREVLAATLN